MPNIFLEIWINKLLILLLSLAEVSITLTYINSSLKKLQTFSLMKNLSLISFLLIKI